MRYLIGLDFGTESARAVLVSEKGAIIAQAKKNYPHGLITSPDKHENLKEIKESFPPETVLVDPEDYLEVLRATVKKVVSRSKILPTNIVGLGLAFTSSIMPLNSGHPLNQFEEFRNNPHAFAKKWKHQAAREERKKTDQVAKEREEAFLPYYGRNTNIQFVLPKILETLNRAPEVYQAADRFIEAADWLVLELTSKRNLKTEERRSICFAGYKAHFVKSLKGYPGKDFLRAIDPRLENLVEEKLNSKVCNLGEKAGRLHRQWAKILGLKEGTAVAIPGIDAHLGAIGAGIQENRLIIVMGTSFCQMYTAPEFREIPGLFGIIEDGILPGMFGYEGGQAAGGDILAHFVEESVSPKYFREAKRAGLDIQSYLTRLARLYQPGETGLLCLDWQGGNRSVLSDPELSALIIGEKLSTTAPQKYRALIESIIFGAYKIIKEMEGAGLKIDDVVACGGVAEKNDLVLQILADVMGQEVKMAGSQDTTALGAAILAAVAAKLYPSITEAQKAMTHLSQAVFGPNQRNHKIYQKLFKLYEREYDHFGRGKDNIMKELLKIQAEAREEG